MCGAGNWDWGTDVAGVSWPVHGTLEWRSWADECELGRIRGRGFLGDVCLGISVLLPELMQVSFGRCRVWLVDGWLTYWDRLVVGAAASLGDVGVA